MGDGGGHPWARAAIRLRYTNVVSLQRKPAAWGSLPWLLDGGSGVNGVVRLSGPCKRGCRRRHAWKKRGVAGCVAVQVRQHDGLTHRQLTSYTCPHGFSNLGGFNSRSPRRPTGAAASKPDRGWSGPLSSHLRDSISHGGSLALRTELGPTDLGMRRVIVPVRRLTSPHPSIQHHTSAQCMLVKESYPLLRSCFSF